MSEKLEELIILLYQDKLTQYGKRSLVENIEKLQKENKAITQQRDYYKARYDEFNEAFIENGRKLTK